ncbi:MAG: hypothetical protein ABEI39_06790 [Halobacteriales archaeon]
MASRARPDDGPSAIPLSTSVASEFPESDGDGPISADALRTLEPYLDPAEGTAPLELVAVLAGERPAAWLTQPSTLSAGALRNLLDALPVHHRPSPGGSGPVVAVDPDRFDRLPDPGLEREAFDARMGRFLGYPDDAVAQYARDTPTTRAGTVLVDRGTVEPSAFAYTRFTPWIRSFSRANLQRQIRDGRRIAHRLLGINARCGATRIAGLVATLYHRERRALAPGDEAPASLLRRLVPDWLVALGDEPRVPELDDSIRIDAGAPPDPRHPSDP